MSNVFPLLFVTYFMMLSISILCSTEWKTGEQRIGKNLERSHHGITEMLFQHLPGEIEKNHKTSVMIASFLAKIGITVLQIQGHSITATHICSYHLPVSSLTRNKRHTHITSRFIFQSKHLLSPPY
jgi:hypothetical protein